MSTGNNIKRWILGELFLNNKVKVNFIVNNSFDTNKLAHNRNMLTQWCWCWSWRTESKMWIMFLCVFDIVFHRKCFISMFFGKIREYMMFYSCCFCVFYSWTVTDQPGWIAVMNVMWNNILKTLIYYCHVCTGWIKKQYFFFLNHWCFNFDYSTNILWWTDNLSIKIIYCQYILVNNVLILQILISNIVFHCVWGNINSQHKTWHKWVWINLF